MQITVNFTIPELWANDSFSKSDWGSINYLIGPNGTGKSKFIQKLHEIFRNQSIRVRYLNADRLASWIKNENQAYVNSQLSRGGINLDWFSDLKQNSRVRGESNDAFVLLKENLDVRIKVESVLSQLLNRTVILEEKGGFLIPSVSKDNKSYSFKEQESHGLKEMITLLTFLHDDTYDCLIVDEPELHLHPQYQSFFLQEVRKVAGDPQKNKKKKCFFFATHSPHFIDIRTIEDLKNCIIFQPDKAPKYIDKLEPEDEFRLNQLLPKLNTHHKQFFFSTRPIFVEGNSDQQIFSLIQEKRQKFVGSSGTTFIDVNGKNDQELFFRLCRKLSINCQIITDLDSLLSGKLRQTVSNEESCKTHLQTSGVATDFFTGMSEIHKKIDECGDELIKIFSNIASPTKNMQQLHQSLLNSKSKEESRYVVLLAIKKFTTELTNSIPNKKGEIQFISGRIEYIIDAFKQASVYVLTDGELENYGKNIDNHFNLTDSAKGQFFIEERDYLLQNNPDENELKSRYGNLITILDESTKGTKVEYKTNLMRYLQDFIYYVQRAFRYDGIHDAESIKLNRMINYQSYSNILELVEFTPVDSKFNCKIKLKEFEDIGEQTLEFSDSTIPTAFTF
jgi:predicted ATP-dependent endonuclease of OLD family